MIEVDTDFNEKTIMSIILFSDNMDIDTLNNTAHYLPDKMLANPSMKKLYNIILELAKSNDYDLMGTEHFRYKVSLIAQIEISDAFDIQDLEKYWCPKATLKNFIKKVQAKYFEERFKAASSQQEFEDIIAEKQEYSIVPDMTNISSEAELVLEDYERRKNSAIYTGLPSVDKLIGSLQGGDMIVLAGSSGGGKTCFMLNIATNMAKSGKKVDIFSLEMPRMQLQQRIICCEAMIDASKFRAFTLSSSDKKKYAEYVNGPFKDLPIRIYKQQTASIDLIKYIVMKSDSDVVFIDYLGLINSYNNKSTYDKFSDISREIKLLAMAANKPIIALHQLNRDFQKRDNKEPQTSDLRDSGKIEQDADMIWFVFRPGLFNENVAKEDLVFILAKDRHGDANKKAHLIFNGMYQQVKERIKVSA